MRLIDANAWIISLDELSKTLIRDIENEAVRDAYKIAFGLAIYKASKAPTIDTEPVRHGKWLEADDPYTCRCSECNERIDEIDADNYCPCCGAKMEARLTPEGVAKALLKWKSEEERDEE